VSGSKTRDVVVDLSTREGAHALIAETLARSDATAGIGGLVNVVGSVNGPLDQPLWEITTEQWTKTVALNLDSAFHCISEVLPTMMARRSGRVVNIGSTSWAGSPQRAHYAAATAGLVPLTRSAARTGRRTWRGPSPSSCRRMRATSAVRS
jgi:NAD(P)-dependent dehydrogenase (short-subunit alcohol dehydrogenase family)